MIILLNGKKEEAKDGVTISGLLKDRNIREEVVTVELNDDIVERPKYNVTFIKDRDKIEFVYYMGGGAHAF